MKARFTQIKTTTLYSDDDHERSNNSRQRSDGPARCALAPAGISNMDNLFSSCNDSTLRSATPRGRPARSTSMPTNPSRHVNFEHITERSPERSLYITARDESLPHEDKMMFTPARAFFSAEFSDVGHNQTQIELRRGMTENASLPENSSNGKVPTSTPRVDLLRLRADGQSDLEIHMPPATEEITHPSATLVHVHHDRDGRSHVSIGNMDEINDTIKSFTSLDSDRPFSSKNMPKAASSAVKNKPVATRDVPVIIITNPTPETSLETPDDVDESWRTPRRIVNNATYTVNSVKVPGTPSNVNLSGVDGLDFSGNIRPPRQNATYTLNDPNKTPRRPPPRNALRTYPVNRYQDVDLNFSDTPVNARRRLSFPNDPNSPPDELAELNVENAQLGYNPTRTPRRPVSRNAMRSTPEPDRNFSNTSGINARRRLSFAMQQNSSSGLHDLGRLNEENDENPQQQPVVGVENYDREDMQIHVPVLPNASNARARTPSPAPRRAGPKKKKKQQRRASRQELFELDEAILTTRQRIQRRARLQREELQREMDARAQQALLQRRRPSQQNHQRSVSSPPFNYEGLFNWSREEPRPRNFYY